MSPSPSQSALTEPRLLVLDRHITPRHILILASDKVRNLLILRLLDSRLIALVSLSKAILLYCIDAYITPSYRQLFVTLDKSEDCVQTDLYQDNLHSSHSNLPLP